MLLIIELKLNENIREKEVRVVDENGAQLGIMPTNDARKLAVKEGLDLVLIAPTAKPPVCKIIDYGKYRYEMERKEKEAKKKQKTVDVKEVRFSPNIDVNDINTKLNQTRKFLLKGDKVKVSLRFRGRELSLMNHTRHILEDFVIKLNDIAVVEKPVKLEGRSLSVVLMKRKEK